MPIVWLKNIEHYDTIFLRNIRNENQHFFFTSAIRARPITLDEQESWMKAHIGRQDPEFFIVMLDSDRIGTVSINRFTGEIGHVLLLASARGKGYGLQLMNIAINMVRHHAKTPMVNLLTDNIPAKKLYEKLGFEVTRITMELIEKEEDNDDVPF